VLFQEKYYNVLKKLNYLESEKLEIISYSKLKLLTSRKFQNFAKCHTHYLIHKVLFNCKIRCKVSCFRRKLFGDHIGVEIKFLVESQKNRAKLTGNLL